MTHFFVTFTLLSSSLLSSKWALHPTNFSMICPPNSCFINLITFLFFPLGNGLSISKFEVSNLVSTSSSISFQISSAFA